MLIILLFLVMLYVMLMRSYLPKGVKVPGKLIARTQLTMVERFMLQRVNLYAIGSVLLLMTLTHTIPNYIQFFVLLATQVILMLPVRIALTSEGVAISNVVFRPWSDFTGYSAASRRITLIGREGTRPLNIPLLAGHQKEVIVALKRHLPEIKARKEAWQEHGVTVG